MAASRRLGPGFRTLFRGSLVTNTGDGIRLAALPLLATTLTSSPLIISAVTAAQVLPWLVFAPVGGALVDRGDRRHTILTTQAWRGAVMAALAAVVWADVVAVWHICLVAFLITAGEILVDPSIVALVPVVVGDSDLDRANGRIASAEIITNDFAGGPVGAAAFAAAPWLPFLIDAATYLGSLLPFRNLPRIVHPAASAPSNRPRRSSLLFDAREGFAWLRGHPILGPVTATFVLHYVGLAAAMSLLVVLTTIELGASELAFGLVLAVGALGAFVGSFTAERTAGAIGTRATLAGGVVVQGLALLAASRVGSAHELAGIWVCNGFAAGVQRPVARSLQQRLTPNHLLGRVNVTGRIFTRGVMVLGALAAGMLAALTSVRWSFAAGGVIQVAAGLLMWRVLAPPTPTITTTRLEVSVDPIDG